MSDTAFSPMATIAAKDIRDATRDRFVLIVTLFLALGAVVALVSGAIALRTDAATYAAAKETLLALGKSVNQIAAPEFYPLKLMRGAIEQIGIVGAAIAILIGYRAAASERGRQTLTLILTRPIRRWQFLAGKIAAGLALLGVGLLAVLAILASTPDVEDADGDSGTDEASEMTALQGAKVSLLQAITTAEGQGGKALSAEYGQEDGALAIEVEMADASGKTVDLKVDAMTGQVMAADSDAGDEDGENGESDEGSEENKG